MTEKDLLRMIAAILPLLPECFVGRIEFNTFLGSITNVNVEQSFKPNKNSGHRGATESWCTCSTPGVHHLPKGALRGGGTDTTTPFT